MSLLELIDRDPIASKVASSLVQSILSQVWRTLKQGWQEDAAWMPGLLIVLLGVAQIAGNVWIVWQGDTSALPILHASEGVAMIGAGSLAWRIGVRQKEIQ